MWWLMIWNFIKDPKNIVITCLVGVLSFVALFTLSLYVGKAVVDVKLKKAQQQLEAQEQMIENLTSRNKEYAENMKQIRVAQDKLLKIKTAANRIEVKIEEATDEKGLVDARNDLVDLLYDRLRDQPAVKAE